MALTCVIVAMCGFITSCNSYEPTTPVGGGNDNSGTGDDVKSGEPTWMTLNLSFPAPNSTLLRATTAAGDIDETALNTVDVFIYSGDNDYYSSHTHLTGSDFQSPVTSGVNVTYNAKPNTQIPTTTGGKKVFVGVNLPADLATALENKPAIELRNVVRTFLTISDLASATNGIAMTNAADSLFSKTFTVNNQAVNNLVNAQVQRLVAKVTVTEDPNIVTTGIDGTIIYPLQWGINNYNTKTFLLQNIDWSGGVNNLLYIDPNYYAADYNANDLLPVSSFIQVRRFNSSSDADLLPAYTTENTSDRQLEKELTSVVIRGQFIPKNIIVQQNDTFRNATSSRTTAATFWSIIVRKGPIPEIAFFEDKTVADNYKASMGGAADPVQEYTNGYCYWHLFLHDQSYNFGVVRNNYYRCSITRIVFPGMPNALVPDPEKKPDVPTNMSVTITVIPWNDVTVSTELAP